MYGNKRRVIEYVNSDYHREEDELIIVDEETITKDYGWVFFAVNKKYLESQFFGDMVIGRGPVLFERESESIIPFGTALSAEQYLEQYEKQKSDLS